MRAHPRVAVALTLIIGAIPMVFLGSYVARHGVEVPHMDDWEIAPVIAKAHSGQLRFADLFTQEEEARMIVPKLIFIASTWRGHWDVRDQMMLSVFVCAATAAGVYVLLRRSGLGIGVNAICFWLTVLLIFSPAQFELWLFASGFPSFMPIFFIVAALLLYDTSLPVSAKFAASAALSLMSSFTLAHGLLAWALTFPVYLAVHRGRHWKIWATAWLMATACCAAIYLNDYSKPAHLPDFAPTTSMADYARFFVAFLGGSFAYASKDHRVGLAMCVGSVALALFICAAGYVIARWRDEALVRRTLPWFAIGCYSLGSGALATLGRVGFGHEYSISSRYVTFSLYLIVAVIVLLAVVGSAALKVSVSPVLRIAAPSFALVLLIIGVNLFAAGFGRSMRILDSIWARQRLARAALLFSPAVDTSAVIKRISYPQPETVKSRAVLLDRLGLLRPRLVTTNRLEGLQHTSVDEVAASGWCDAVLPLDAERIRASGWAALNARGRPVDAVVLAYHAGTDEPVIFAMSDEIVRRKDIARLLGSRAQLWSGWSVTFRRDAVPAGALVSAWGVDADGPTLYRLRQNTPELKL